MRQTTEHAAGTHLLVSHGSRHLSRSRGRSPLTPGSRLLDAVALVQVVAGVGAVPVRLGGPVRSISGREARNPLQAGKGVAFTLVGLPLLRHRGHSQDRRGVGDGDLRGRALRVTVARNV